jgi:hypothetical protein
MEKDVPVDQIQTILSNLNVGIEEDEEDDAKSVSTFDFIYNQIRDFYVDNIPVEIVKQLPFHG